MIRASLPPKAKEENKQKKEDTIRKEVENEHKKVEKEQKKDNALPPQLETESE